MPPHPAGQATSEREGVIEGDGEDEGEGGREGVDDGSGGCAAEVESGRGNYSTVCHLAARLATRSLASNPPHTWISRALRPCKARVLRERKCIRVMRYVSKLEIHTAITSRYAMRERKRKRCKRKSG